MDRFIFIPERQQWIDRDRGKVQHPSGNYTDIIYHLFSQVLVALLVLPPFATTKRRASIFILHVAAASGHDLNGQMKGRKNKYSIFNPFNLFKNHLPSPPSPAWPTTVRE